MSSQSDVDYVREQGDGDEVAGMQEKERQDREIIAINGIQHVQESKLGCLKEWLKIEK